MELISLVDLKCSCNSSGLLTFEWKLPVDKKVSYINICPDYNGLPNIDKRAWFPVKGSANGQTINSYYPSVGVKRRYYYVFACCDNKSVTQEESRALLGDSRFRVSVVQGNTQLEYSIKRNADGGLCKYSISLTSMGAIQQGIVGYSFSCLNHRFILDFPGDISAGMSKFQPISLPRDCDLRVQAIDLKGANSLLITEKKTFLQSLKTFLKGDRK